MLARQWGDSIAETVDRGRFRELAFAVFADFGQETSRRRLASSIPDVVDSLVNSVHGRLVSGR